jgi:hypothetical protein
MRDRYAADLERVREQHCELQADVEGGRKEAQQRAAEAEAAAAEDEGRWQAFHQTEVERLRAAAEQHLTGHVRETEAARRQAQQAHQTELHQARELYVLSEERCKAAEADAWRLAEREAAAAEEVGRARQQLQDCALVVENAARAQLSGGAAATAEVAAVRAALGQAEVGRADAERERAAAAAEAEALRAGLAEQRDQQAAARDEGWTLTLSLQVPASSRPRPTSA